jgi:hypothetical protein
MSPVGDPFAAPLLGDHVEKKNEHALALSKRIEQQTAKDLLIKDLALHAALAYYGAVMKTGQSYPPKTETIVRTAKTFEDYYADFYGPTQ